MYGHKDLSTLIDLAGTWSMSNGWQIMIRADWTDVSSGRPHGLSYALILQDQQGRRLLGFDNSHAYDGAAEDAPFDHEHRANAVGLTYAYKFTSASQLITDFVDRCGAFCAREGVEFVVEDIQ